MGGVIFGVIIIVTLLAIAIKAIKLGIKHQQEEQERAEQEIQDEQERVERKIL